MASLQGPILMVAAMVGFAVEDAVIKTLAARMPPGQIALALGLIGGTVFALLLRRHGLRLLVPQALRGAALVRNLAEVGAVITMTLGVALVPLSVVSSILQAMPLAVTMGAALVLGEKVGWRRWSAILVGFVGVLMIVRPGFAGFDRLALIPLAAVVFLSVRDIATRRVAGAVSSLQVAGWGFLAALPGGLLMLAMRGEVPVLPAATDALLLVGMAIIGIAAYGALVRATRADTLAVTTPFRYSRLVFAMLIGVIVFGERPDGWTLAGSALVVAAGLYTMLREMRLARLR